MRSTILLSRLAAGIFLAAGLTNQTTAHEYQVGPLTVDHPHSFPAPAVAPSGLAFFTITNTGETADRLIAVEVPAVEGTSLHRTELGDDGIARMLPQADGIEILAGETVVLEPGGLHVMLEGLGGDALEEGERLPATLIFERAGPLEVEISVDARDADAPEVDHSAHGH
ncbi:copper chaperone PCu(A)C [Jannaschia marina]|uniref:copper chaperone PCu(A)C n=1 Tax=Jannaschia marina TaxID=2741674 RepID=UPI0015CCF3AB|nr:copper chaperone PCu(A)C [Jannaschia marina]